MKSTFQNEQANQSCHYKVTIPLLMSLLRNMFFLRKKAIPTFMQHSIYNILISVIYYCEQNYPKEHVTVVKSCFSVLC